jgi:hypothetical protein
MKKITRLLGAAKVAEFDQELSGEDLAAFVKLKVDGVLLKGAAATSAHASEWLCAMRPRVLIIESGGKVQSLSPEALGEVKLLMIDARARLVRPIDVRNLPAAEEVVVNESHCHGQFREMGNLTDLWLTKVSGSALSMNLVSGCTSLQKFRLQAARESIDETFELECSEPPSRLEQLYLQDVRIATLSGIQEFPTIKNLMVIPRKSPNDPPVIDLTPLERCPQLEWLAIGENGRFVNRDVLEHLPHLRQVGPWLHGLG